MGTAAGGQVLMGGCREVREQCEMVLLKSAVEVLKSSARALFASAVKAGHLL